MSTPTSLVVGDPAELGFDPARLAAIDAFIADRYVDAGRYPGYTLLISRHGQIAHLSTNGYDQDAIFRFFSMSKPVTSVALLSLMEKGLVKLGDPVSAYIPAFADLRVWQDGTATNYTTTFPEREMTVKDLLTHTSGLTYGFMGRHPVDAMYRAEGIERMPGNSLADMCAKLAEVPLLFSPGTQWSYSVATDVCGHLVELISGQPLDEFFRTNIFEPLGMVDTGFWVDDARADRLVPNFANPLLSPFGVPEGVSGAMAQIDGNGPDSPYRSPPTFLSGGGGLVSTVADYHRFTQMLVGGGRLDDARILGRKTLDFATQNHLPTGGDLASMGQAVFSETSYEGIGFGLGWSVMLDPARANVPSSPGEYGWGGAASTVFWVDPAEALTVIGLTQLMPSSAYPIRTELKALVYGALT
jgi:CubicO group peptidase (beta-lactamase class C family)